jgi:hypothetical protein
VHTIFRKAQVEHSYVGFYGQLCSKIIKLELNAKGIKATPSQGKNSSFRNLLLEYCKQSFESFFDNPPKIDIKATDDNFEEDLRRKHKLYGNIEFCGILHKNRILSDSILWSVFEGLLGLKSGENQDLSVNENTVEAAIRLISKLGRTIEDKIANSSEENKVKQQEKLNEVFKQFKYLENCDSTDPTKKTVSTRVKLLIKNMFDNKESGWKKSEDKNSEIQTKKEIEDEVFKKAQEKEDSQN